MEKERKELHLIKEGEKTGIIPMLLSRYGLVVLLFLAEIALMIFLFIKIDNLKILVVLQAIFFLVALTYLVNHPTMGPEGKMTWLLLIVAIPVGGLLFFLFTQTNVGYLSNIKNMNEIIRKTKDNNPQNPETYEKLRKDDKEIAGMVNYLNKANSHPVYDNSTVEYFPLGEYKLEALLDELEKAEKYIYFEYFIINEGKAWGQILDVLARKAKEGLDVRVIYDATVELSALPHDYTERLASIGIKAKSFSPFTLYLSTNYNYRNHRKIVVIDGHTGFTGGINLADEYMNMKVKYGHWKDTAVMVKGEACKTLKQLFIQDWNLDEKVHHFKELEEVDEYPKYKNSRKGYIVPFGDQPFDQYNLGERVYIDILNRADKYCYIMTPYLVYDRELEQALKYAAQRGVDVELILPGIPDKKFMYAIARANYNQLLRAGVKIYEYTPGFVHAKMFVSDHEESVVGTINLDYRSLYHHFECGLYMYKSPAVKKVYEDFLETREKCREVTVESNKKNNMLYVAIGSVLKFIGPLL